MDQFVLVLTTFVAATLNGALGDRFSSITVPVALLFYIAGFPCGTERLRVTESSMTAVAYIFL